MMAGVYLNAVGGGGWLLVVAVPVALIACYIARRMRVIRRMVSTALICVAACGTMYAYTHALHTHYAAQGDLPAYTLLDMVGEVVALYGNYAHIRLVSVDIPENKRDWSNGTYTVLRMYYDSDKYLLNIGDLITVNGQYVPMRGYYGDDNALYAAYAKGIHGTLRARASTISVIGYAERVSPLTWTSHRIRQYMAHVIDGRFDTLTGALLKAVAFGDVYDLPQSAQQAIRNSGLSHITAMSGLHMNTLLMLCSYVFIRVCKRNRTVICCNLLCAAILTLILGYTPSILRTAIMLCVAQCAIPLRRRCDGLTALAISGIVMLCINPFYLFGASFILSFSATAGIIVLQPLIRTLSPWRGGIVDVAATSLGASLSTFYFVSRMFNILSFSAIITNVLVAGLMPYMLGGVYLLLLVNAIPIVSDWLVWLLVRLSQCILGVATLFGQVLPMYMTVASPNVIMLCIYGILLYIIYQTCKLLARRRLYRLENHAADN